MAQYYLCKYSTEKAVVRADSEEEARSIFEKYLEEFTFHGKVWPNSASVKWINAIYRETYGVIRTLT